MIVSTDSIKKIAVLMTATLLSGLVYAPGDAGALELRSGIPEGAPPDSSGPDMIGAMSTGLFLDFIGIRMDSKQAEALGEYSINLITPDNGEKFAIELSNATLTNVEGFLHNDPDEFESDDIWVSGE
jgi:alkyl sulfatase BDS1-like metallo-beta-lactamase superfamily hydrolase